MAGGREGEKGGGEGRRGCLEEGPVRNLQVLCLQPATQRLLSSPAGHTVTHHSHTPAPLYLQVAYEGLLLVSLKGACCCVLLHLLTVYVEGSEAPHLKGLGQHLSGEVGWVDKWLSG